MCLKRSTCATQSLGVVGNGDNGWQSLAMLTMVGSRWQQWFTMVDNGWQSLAMAGNGRQLMLIQILKNWSFQYAPDQLLNSVSFQISESHTKALENLLFFIIFYDLTKNIFAKTYMFA